MPTVASAHLLSAGMPESGRRPELSARGAIPPVESPSVPDALSDVIGVTEGHEQEERIGVITPVDWLTGQFVDVGMSGLESSLWTVGDKLAGQLHPVGPQVVRWLYLTKQVVEMFKRYRSGDGFYVKFSVPDLDLPPGMEFIFRIRLGFLNQDSTGFGCSAEIQILEPWFPDLDVKHTLPDTAGKLGRGIPPVHTPAPRHDDPWCVWLALIGDGLILDLARTLADATGTPLDKMTTRLRDLRTRGQSQTRLATPGWM